MIRIRSYTVSMENHDHLQLAQVTGIIYINLTFLSFYQYLSTWGKKRVSCIVLKLCGARVTFTVLIHATAITLRLIDWCSQYCSRTPCWWWKPSPAHTSVFSVVVIGAADFITAQWVFLFSAIRWQISISLCLEIMWVLTLNRIRTGINLFVSF